MLSSSELTRIMVCRYLVMASHEVRVGMKPPAYPNRLTP
jgi:hypothetical protein